MYPKVFADYFRNFERSRQAHRTGEQRDWKVPPDPSEVKGLASSYRNAALGEIVVRAGKDEVVFQFGG
jgi:hypothetical protein